ncbi:OLC1v1009680C5 [Oldenlandia corymbosa var. corymbosa]|uniref:OLC1v1009680C5 n=1 Tax=Oldenlandia corymbosa var. corymbosa TaxID=529605 RepID=A0AAV1DSS7_OLDCO|nr:OLC1v1009680C5 [Oldenlandia corymbosa var. corymbosa]
MLCFLRWIAKLLQGVKFCWNFEVDSVNENPPECYACTQVGVPVFHSTTCDQDHRPELEASAGSSLFPINHRFSHSSDKRRTGLLGRVLDPRCATVKKWNRFILLDRGIALAVDPLFFFAVSIRGGGGGGNQPCIDVDGRFVTVVALVRSCVDLVHTWHALLQFRLAYVSKKTMAVGCGKLVWDPRAVAFHYLRSVRGFWLDFFVILPLPQIVYLYFVPKLRKEDRIQFTMSMLQVIFLLQFLPKVYHSFSLMQRMRKVTGYIFGSIWWGFCINLVAYFLASHVSGGCWYILALQRAASCLSEQCYRNKKYSNQTLSCARQFCFFASKDTVFTRNASSTYLKSICLDADGPFRYGLYQLAVSLFSMDSVMTKILYSNLWGLMALSTMGNNLEPTSRCSEVIFSILMVLGGLLLFTMLIGNIQVFLQAVMQRRRNMQLRCRDIEWWMRRRQLPTYLKQRVRGHNQQWNCMAGQNEMEFIRDLPEGLRRDIKRYLCLDLITKVPLFCHLDDLILDNICDRVKPLVYSKDEKVCINLGSRFSSLWCILRANDCMFICCINKSSLIKVHSISNPR